MIHFLKTTAMLTQTYVKRLSVQVWHLVLMRNLSQCSNMCKWDLEKGQEQRDCGILLTPVERAVGSSKAYRLREHMTREGARRGAYTLNIWTTLCLKILPKHIGN